MSQIIQTVNWIYWTVPNQLAIPYKDRRSVTRSVSGLGTLYFTLEIESSEKIDEVMESIEFDLSPVSRNTALIDVGTNYCILDLYSGSTLILNERYVCEIGGGDIDFISCDSFISLGYIREWVDGKLYFELISATEFHKQIRDVSVISDAYEIDLARPSLWSRYIFPQLFDPKLVETKTPLN